MASTNAAPSADTPIAIKLALNNGENRRFKLTLRDLGANTLPEKLRSLLAVPLSRDITFERFSDSAGSYIPLDSNNPAVYKQLYRAAKAKLKLRIKATIADASSPENHSAGLQNSLPTDQSTPSKDAGTPSMESVTHAEHLLRGLADATANLDTGAKPASPCVPSQQPPRPNLRCKLPYDPCSSPSVTAMGTTSLLDTANPKPELMHHTLQDYQMQLMLLEQQNKRRELMRRQESGVCAATTFAGFEAPVPRSFAAREDLIPEIASLSVGGLKDHGIKPKSAPVGPLYSICCNKCEANITDAFWHCSTCNNDDYDLCGQCIDKGILCDGEDHWLIKRTIEKGEIVNSTTETMAPKKVSDAVAAQHVPTAPTSQGENNKVAEKPADLSMYRTCNSCVEVFDDSKFVTCRDCEDFDLCIPCFVGSKHGHHPSHAFAPAHPSTKLDNTTAKLCLTGRNVRHQAFCDGCDKQIYGTRHKCLNCPDWDYCSKCIKGAKTSHPGHRFIQAHEPIPMVRTRASVHSNIHCDGPLCKDNKQYIMGDRYKCAVCHDTDFCAKCEALPVNRHNRTHPLIKFKSPVRNVSVTTLGEKENGEHMCSMGDQLPPQFTSKATETVPVAPSANAATQVQTVAEVKPTEAAEEKEPKYEVFQPAPAPELQGHFIRDTVADGTLLPPGQRFVQTWTIRNPGPYAWSAGCSIRFVGGDSMFNVDPNHPSSVSDIKKATESNVTDRVVEVGEEVHFTVIMRAPEREGKAISYWRLKDVEGSPFGHKLWCDVVVARRLDKVVPSETTADPETVKDQGEDEAATESQMIFPKLDKESSVSSTHILETHEAAAGAPLISSSTGSVTSAVTAHEEKGLVEEVENLSLEDDVSTEDGFLTDEEFELLDASEDDFAEAANGKPKK